MKIAIEMILVALVLVPTIAFLVWVTRKAHQPWEPLPEGKRGEFSYRHPWIASLGVGGLLSFLPGLLGVPLGVAWVVRNWRRYKAVWAEDVVEDQVTDLRGDLENATADDFQPRP